nr:MAG TPA: hypothetical protein [Caudoviricetes sp.]
MFKILSISLVVIIAITSFILFIIWEFYKENFKVSEWFTFCSTILTIVMTSYTTISAVIISTYYMKINLRQEKTEKLNKLKGIVYIELKNYTCIVKKNIFNCVNNNISKLDGINSEVKIKDLYIIRDEIKDMIYEIILLEPNLKMKDDLYKIYQYFLVDYDNKYRYNNTCFFSPFLKGSYSKMLDWFEKLNSSVANDEKNDEIKKKLNRILQDSKNWKGIKLNSRVNNVIEYLKESIIQDEEDL